MKRLILWLIFAATLSSFAAMLAASSVPPMGNDDRNAVKTYYAACEDGHAFWRGENRGTFQQAAKDGKEHDDQRHSGEKTAAVIISTK